LEAFIASLRLNFTRYLLLARYPGERNQQGGSIGNQPNASLLPKLIW